MNRDAAKKLLALYRSEKLDGDLPGMREALKLAQEDAELRTFLEENSRSYSAIKAQLKKVPVPADLRDRILAARKIIPLWKRRQFLSAVAASIAVIAGGAALWQQLKAPEKHLAHFQGRMLDYAIRSYGMDIRTNDPEKLRDFLAMNGAPIDFPMAQDSAALPVIGGARLSWKNRPVSMICFKVKEKTAYLFVVGGADLPTDRLEVPRFGRYEPLSEATWAYRGHVFLLGAEISEAELREVVARLLG
jgi:hypothetical protein